jgi:hypothetical protein
MGTNDQFGPSFHNLKDKALNRTTSTLKFQADQHIYVGPPPQHNSQASQISGRYSDNPSVHFTALAHLQWKHVLRPGDAAIDATCGNGYDSCKLAESMFKECETNDSSELICIDIQAIACEATRNALAQILDPIILDRRVRIIQASHTPLPRSSAPLALVCWNLGYLPNADEKRLYTKMESTVDSIADAALRLRVGGLLSVMTYPKTNPNEDYAVHALFEAMALLSSTQIYWTDYLLELGEDAKTENGDSLFTVKDCVSAAMKRIVEQGDGQQTWRVMEHKMMGRPMSPQLLTATRIK